MFNCLKTLSRLSLQSSKLSQYAFKAPLHFEAMNYRSFSLLSSSKPALASLCKTNFASPFKPTCPGFQQIRCVTYGNEYQPSNTKRKRKHGFLKRQRTRSGQAILRRRLNKGRLRLSH